MGELRGQGSGSFLKNKLLPETSLLEVTYVCNLVTLNTIQETSPQPPQMHRLLGNWRGEQLDVGEKPVLRAPSHPVGGTSLQESHSQGTEIHEISWNKQRLLAPAGKEANCCFGTTGLAQSTFPRNQHIPAAGQFVFTTRVRNVKGTGARSPERPLAEPCTLASASEDAVRQADSGSATQTL